MTDTLNATNFTTNATQPFNQTCYILPHYGFGNEEVGWKMVNLTVNVTSITVENCTDSYPNNYWMCILGMLLSMIFFRIMTVAILMS